MISLKDLWKEFGRRARLLPFFKCLLLYFAVFCECESGEGGEGPLTGAGAGAGGEEAWQLLGMVAKCAPVLCLLIFVMLHRADDGASPEARRYCGFISLGLVLSAVGDAVLVCPQGLVPGLAAFSAAHLSYIAAFGLQPRAYNIALPLYLTAAFYCTILEVPDSVGYLVQVYTFLLSTMTWRAAARGSVSAAAGGFAFLLSDAILALNMFNWDNKMPYRQLLVMSTYYFGQMNIAISAAELTREGKRHIR